MTRLKAVDVVIVGAGRARKISNYASTHLHGGAIMGDDPSIGVVNSYPQRWQIHNLFVIGPSAFPQSGPANPTLTVLAITLRSADSVMAII